MNHPFSTGAGVSENYNIKTDTHGQPLKIKTFQKYRGQRSTSSCRQGPLEWNVDLTDEDAVSGGSDGGRQACRSGEGHAERGR